MLQTATTRSPARTGGIALLVLGGGVALVGVVLDWATGTATFEGGEIFGQAITPDLLPVEAIPTAGQEITVSGTSDVLGIVAGIAGLLCIGLGLTALAWPGSGGRALLAGGVAAGLVTVALAAAGVASSERLIRDEMVGQAREAVDAFLGGFDLLGFAGGLVDAVIEQVIGLFEFDARPRQGVFVTGAGGLVAVIGGAIGALGGGRDRLREAAARMDPAFRAELLSIIAAPPEARAEAGRRLSQDPAKHGLAELVGSLERDEDTRLALIEVLRQMEAAPIPAGPAAGPPPSPPTA